jgi:hypothetical protein
MLIVNITRLLKHSAVSLAITGTMGVAMAIVARLIMRLSSYTPEYFGIGLIVFCILNLLLFGPPIFVYLAYVQPRWLPDSVFILDVILYFAVIAILFYGGDIGGGIPGRTT